MNTSPVSVEQLQRFFLEAAAETYARKGAEKGTITDLPGSKVFYWSKDGLMYLDTYVTNGPYSGGQTLIYADGRPVWMMQYQGWCQDDDPEILTFLKEALAATYGAGEFHLGRGPARFEEHRPQTFEGTAVTHPLIYECLSTPAGFGTQFMAFDALERIYRFPRSHEILFFHRIQGMLLRDGDSDNDDRTPIDKVWRQ